MSANGELTFDFKPQGKSGKGILSAKTGVEPIYTHKLDITDADARNKFIKSLCDGRKGIEPKAVAQELEKLASGCIGDGSDAGDDQRFTQSQALVNLTDGVELWHDGDTAYATIQTNEHRENHAVNGKGFRSWLAPQFWLTSKKASGAQAMQDALGVLSGKALYDGPQYATAVRLAEHNGAVYLDLADEKWRAVKVTVDGWEVVDDPPVKFIRRRGIQPLPEPDRGGKIGDLRPLINASDDSTWVLLIAWLIGAFRPQGPYAALGINGEQGSAKSTCCRMLRQLIDPNDADLRSAPREDRDLMIAATNAWIVGFDNLSSIATSLSDSLCRLATGGGFATRELYTDAEEKLFRVARPILFNGIEELATRPDLLERSIVVNLPPILDEQRMTEAQLWEQFELARPRILGALLNAIAEAMKNLSTVKLDKSPRMADFAKWVVSAEPALPWKPGAFIRAYAGNRDAANELALEASPIGPAIVGMMQDLPRWEGTATKLLTELESDQQIDQRTRLQKDWPKTPKGLSNALRRITPALRKTGIEASFDRSSVRRTIILEQAGQRPSQPSPQSPNAVSASAIGVTGDDALTVGDDANLHRPSPQNAAGVPESHAGDASDSSDGEIPSRSKSATAYIVTAADLETVDELFSPGRP